MNANDKPTPTAPAKPANAWRFAAAFWHSIAIPLPDADDRQDDSLADQLRRAGYGLASTFGDPDGGLSVELWERDGDGRGWLACVMTTGLVELVQLPTLPDLLGFLRETTPLLESIGRLDAAADRRDVRERERCQQRRRQATATAARS